MFILKVKSKGVYSMKFQKTIYKIAELSPFISTENIGDYIIKWYCDQIIKELFPKMMTVLIPTRERLSKLSMKHIASSDYTFICGTNLLSSNMRKFQQWNIHLLDAIGIRCGNLHKNEILNIKLIKQKIMDMHMILFGTGWHQYQNMPTTYTKLLFSLLFDKHYIHSVRDSYTKNMLEEIGIKNVINTSCPTMWKLTEEHCSLIPHVKAKSVVTTFTNYNKDKKYDVEILRMLKRNYKQVFIWLQAIEDYEYLKMFPNSIKEGIRIIPPSLEKYNDLLQSEDIDYVGTRLHGGINALNYKRRSLILAVDNRATEIAKDTNLPVMDRTTNIQSIEEKINNSWITEITLPLENIYCWKNQF